MGERHAKRTFVLGGGKTLLLTLALLALAVAAFVAIIAADFTTAQAQNDDETSGRIVARRLDDGRVEFGWRPTGGARVSPEKRYFPASINHNRWLRSSPVEVDGSAIGRINARRLSDGRIEFAFTPTGGQRILPPTRYFPTNARVGRWLRSTQIEVPIHQVGPDDSGPSPVDRETTRAEQKNLLVERLFGLLPGTADTHTRHAYNDWGCNLVASPSADCNVGDAFYEAHVDTAAWNAYEGGHGGWDVSHRDTAPQFYSLSEGTVIAAGGNDWPCNDIAVYDEDADKTTIYLHAGTVLVRVGDPVSVGTPLGTEGARCRGTVGEHVHLEVHEGRAVVRYGGAWNGFTTTRRIYARGAGQSAQSTHPRSEYSIDPLPYLYWRVTGHQGEPPSATQSPTSTSGSPVVSNDLIREGDSPEVYVVKVENGKQFRRHVVAYGLYAAVPEWDEANVQRISAATFGTIRLSPLVRIPGDAKSVYVVEETGEDDIVLRHIPSPRAFNRAGCDWDGVFAMSRGEYDYWAARAGQRGAPLRGAPVSATYRCPQ